MSPHSPSLVLQPFGRTLPGERKEALVEHPGAPDVGSMSGVTGSPDRVTITPGG